MMKTQISAALRQPPKASLPIPSTSKMSACANMSEDIKPTAVLTPRKDVKGKKVVSRPVGRTKDFSSVGLSHL